ncbi:MAG: SDR family oxidoreductase [Verrucomicrobiaceae bacterium]|nr:SDR family oxidoreductase [Verrucomicrobiaceae bacterium]
MPKKNHSLIIGGTRGMGRVLAGHLAKAGHRVSVIGRREPSPKLPRGIHFFSADLTQTDKLPEVLGEVVRIGGSLSRLVCLQRFKVAPGDAWLGEVATTLTATKIVIESLAEKFAAHGDRSIVLVSSVAAHLVASEQGPGYHVAKAGLNQLARYYAVILGPKNIRVNVVSPGTVLKPENRDFYRGAESLQTMFRKTVPLGRMGTAQEVASVIDFLGGPAASFVTGQTLLVDGGVNLVAPETLARLLAG